VAIATWSSQLGNNVDAETFNIQMIVGGFYTGVDDTLVTIARPTGDFVTGGGYLIEQISQGGTVSVQTTTGDTRDVVLDLAEESKINFGFNMKWNRQQTNLQGRFTAILRDADGDQWRIRSTATESLSVNPATNQATIVTKANLINQATGESAGDLTLIVDMTDTGEPGSQAVDADTIGFTLWNGSTLVFSTNWNGSQTVEQDLAGGNLQLHIRELNAAGGVSSTSSLAAKTSLLPHCSQ
jgi:uncharacterized protein YndB with AHSA1/START domain